MAAISRDFAINLPATEAVFKSVAALAEKVGALSQRLDDPAFPQITYCRGGSGKPVPVLRSTGIRVQTMFAATLNWDMSPAAIAEEYSINELQVKKALAFHEVHRAEIDANIAEEVALDKATTQARG